MKRVKIILLAAVPMVLMFACVSPKKLRSAEAKYSQLDSSYLHLQGELRECQGNLKNKNLQSADFSKEKGAYDKQIADLKSQINYLREHSNIALDRMKDLSVITETQAESIKRSLDNLGIKDLYINDLKRSMAFKDSLNNLLVNNLKSALSDINDQDINIKVEKDVVYVDISDKLLFNSGSYDVTQKAKVVLGKVAKVLGAHPELEFLVEGNTDSKPFRNGLLLDNWDLSTKRATAVARILQYNYHLDPKHITAAGRGEYSPVASNSTAEGRAANRRTRIIILPQLDQFFKLLEKK
ncbi:putative lipoprotein YiaD precursor [mine drainage metagenome]|uniref:Putative lipoprotein YiaD n=1 Tax=mine drainage metagenome TaxID=410659 RepID=A0A1J5RRR9_9ZZZZ